MAQEKLLFQRKQFCVFSFMLGTQTFYAVTDSIDFNSCDTLYRSNNVKYCVGVCDFLSMHSDILHCESFA